MRKHMERLAKRLNPQVMQLTETPLPEVAQAYHGCRYFLVWADTRHVYQAFKTQQECIGCLESMLGSGGAYAGTKLVGVFLPEPEGRDAK